MARRQLTELREDALAEWYAGLTDEDRYVRGCVITVGSGAGEMIARRIVDAETPDGERGPLYGLFKVVVDHAVGPNEWEVTVA